MIQFTAPHRARLERLADWLAILTAVSLPWSRFLTGLFSILWFIAVLPTIDFASFRRELLTPAGGLPVLLIALAVAGIAWSDATWKEDLNSLSRYAKLLAIPVLFVQFRRSERGPWVFFGFLASCLVMLAASYTVAVVPSWHWSEARFGLPVKNPIILSQHFVFCSFALLGIAMGVFAQNRYAFAGALLLVVLAFLASVLFVQVSRTALIYIPVLVLVFALRYFRWRGVAIIIAGALTIGVIAWNSSSYLRGRTMQAITEFQRYEEHAFLSTHVRLEWYRRSLNFWAEKPVFGHGTGAIRGLFDKAVVGETGARAISTANPHNQTLAVAVPLGVVGVIILWAMWLTHWLCFARNSGIAAWIGLVVVTQNIVSSLFNSSIFDLFEGWLYVLGVGVAGGVMRRMAAPGASELTPAMTSRDMAGGASSDTIAAGRRA